MKPTREGTRERLTSTMRDIAAESDDGASPSCAASRVSKSLAVDWMLPAPPYPAKFPRGNGSNSELSEA